MPLELRALVDSISAACLQTVIAAGGSPLVAKPLIKMAVLQLGAACLSTPWPIGTSSAILEHLRTCAQHCIMDDASTSMVAVSALRLCDCMATPRVPALHVDTQSHRIETSSISAMTLIKDIQKADMEQQERAIKSANLKEEQDAKKEQENAKKEQELKVKEAKKKRSSDDNDENAGRKSKVSKSSIESDEQRVDERKGLMSESATICNDSETNRELTEEPDKAMRTSAALTAAATAAENEVGNMADKDDEEMDFLPSIVDDDGPDEDDI